MTRDARALLLILFFCSGCSKILGGGLRKDFDDSENAPMSSSTIGGRWTEQEMLTMSVHQEDVVGHTERSPAAMRPAYDENLSTWISPDQADANQRDVHRNREEPNEAPPNRLQPNKKDTRVTKFDFWDDSPREGSLWAPDGQTNFFFTKNKVRGPGDIVTIQVEKDIVQDTVSEISRTLTPEEKEVELGLAQDRLRAKALGHPDPTAKAGEKPPEKKEVRAPAAAGTEKKPVEEEEISIPKATLADIDVSKSVELNAGEQILAEIVERFPNGNYKIKGTKKIRYHNNPRVLTVLAVVKGTDISEEDTLNSGRLYEYRLEVLR